MRHRRRRGGFTLIELLVVISIISILASMLFPTFAKARNKAEEVDCISNERQLGTAMMMYAMDYDHLLPAHPMTTFENNFQRKGFCVDDWTTRGCWASALYTYTKDYRIFVCKSSNGDASGTNSDIPPISYVMNGCAAGKMIDAAQSPSNTCLLYDSFFDASWCSINPAPDPSSPGAYVRAYFNGQANHDGKYGVLYLDGHAKVMQESIFANDIWYGPNGNMFYY